MRTIVAENGLEETLFDAGTKKLAEVFNVNTDKQRIDSVHIRSNMRRLGRINIFSKSIHRFLKNLKRHHPARLETVDSALIDRYISINGAGLLCHGQTLPESENAGDGQQRSLRPDRAVRPDNAQLQAAAKDLGGAVPAVTRSKLRSRSPSRSLPTHCRTPRTRMPVTAGIKARDIRSR